ncbi:MAG: cytochrome P450 [Pseudonocardiaceae bacterium]
MAQILTGVIEPTATLVAGTLDRMRRSPNIITLLGEGVVTIEDVVEEALRFDAPFHFAPRTASHRFTFHDVVVPENSRVVVVLASVNRDELVWGHPDVFDPGRRHRRHLTFGVGHHSCLGAGVARHLAKSVLDAVLHLDALPRLSPLQRVPAVGSTQFEAERQ